MRYKRQPFIYNNADIASSEDLQSLRYHLVLLFDIQKIISEAGRAVFVPTSEELDDILVDLNVVKKALKMSFGFYYMPAEDIQPYTTLVHELLKKIYKSINKISTCKTLILIYERLRGSIEEDDLRVAFNHYEQCIEKFNAASDYLEDITFNGSYKKMLYLIGLTFL